MNVLFVCTGNVARSQIAGTMFNHLSEHQATSAGTAVRHLVAEGETIEALTESGKESVATYVLELMLEKGFDLSNRVRNQVTPEMVESADRVILMPGRIPAEDFLAQSDKLEVWDITDPFGTSRESTVIIMDEVIQRVHRLVQELD
jgi:protein-tyrosine-phosphatase